MLETPEIPKAFELLLQQAGWDGVSWEGENAVLSCPNCASSDNLRIKRVNGSGGVTDYLVSCFTPECTAYEAICALRHERGVRFPGDETNFRYSRDGRKYKLKLRYILSKPLGKRRAGDRMFAWHHWNGSEFVTAQVAKDTGIYSEWTPLYNLEAAKRASPLSEIWLSEGETDVDAHRRNGVIAVSHPDGAKPISDEQAREIAALAGKVVICGDKDLAGYIAMAQWYEALRAAGAHVDIRIPSGNAKDAKRHYALGGTPEDFVATTPEKIRSERDKRRKLARARSGVSEATPEPDTDNAEDVSPDFTYTQPEYADRVVVEYGDLFRYFADEDQWLYYSDGRWKSDSYDAAFHFVENICRQVLRETPRMVPGKDGTSEVKNPWRATAMERCNAGNIASICRIARTRRPIVSVRRKFDRDPFLLNVQNGTLDLRTMTLRPHDPNDMITKITNAEYDANATGPEFDTYFREVQPRAEKRQQILQGLGYSLNGRYGEVAFVHVGSGGNGKSTLLKLVARTLGDYAVSVSWRVLNKAGEDSHDTYLAELEGKRYAVVQMGGRSLSSEQLRTIVAEPDFKARGMRQDSRTIDSSHTLHIAQNEAPPPSVDASTERRLIVIEWSEQIANPDDELPERLALEQEYVLKLLLAGYAEFSLPTVDRTGTKRYFERNTTYAWLRVETEPDKNSRVPATVLYEAYKKWCDNSGERAASQTAFGKVLTAQGYDRVRHAGGMLRTGLNLIVTDTTPEEESHD